MNWHKIYPWLLYPFVGALIGWFTNRLAVRLLFRPHEPVNFGFWQLQGLLPRRRRQIALSIAQVVEEELFSRQDLLERLVGPAAQEELVATLTQTVLQAFQNRFPLPLPRPFANILRRLIYSEVQRFVKERLPQLAGNLLDQVEITTLVQERLDSLDLVELEQLVYRVSARELGHIEWLGAVVGAAVGLLQAVLVLKFGLGLPGR